MTYSRDDADTWCQRIRENIDSATAHRDVLVDVVRAAIGLPSRSVYAAASIAFGTHLAITRTPGGRGQLFSSVQKTTTSCSGYELFLYVLAVLVKAKKYAARPENSSTFNMWLREPTAAMTSTGTAFIASTITPRSLEEQCSVEGNQKKYSMMAFLIHERATNKHIRFSDVLQADVLLWIVGGGWGWFPPMFGLWTFCRKAGTVCLERSPKRATNRYAHCFRSKRRKSLCKDFCHQS